MQLKQYDELGAEWVAIGTATTASHIENLEVPIGVTVKAFGTDVSTTSAIGIQAKMIHPR
jgi:hypothetical protein